MRSRRFSVRLAVLAAVFLTLAGACLPAAASEAIARITVQNAAFDRDSASVQDVPVGSIAADAVRLAAGADAAVIPCGDFSSADVGLKSFSREDAPALFTADREIAVVQVTAAQLFELLESTLSSVALDPETKQLDLQASRSDAFLQISGLELVYDSAAPAGSRVYSLSLNGAPLDPGSSRTLTLAAGSGVLDGAYGLPALNGGSPAGLRYSEALLAFLAENPLISEYNDQRIRSIGNAGNSILTDLPVPVLVILLALLLCAGVVVTCVRKKQLFDDGGRYFKPKYSMMK